MRRRRCRSCIGRCATRSTGCRRPPRSSSPMTGRSDGSGAALDDLAAADPRVRVLHLSRNYGQTAALMAAIQIQHRRRRDPDGRRRPERSGRHPAAARQSSTRATTSSPAGARSAQDAALTRTAALGHRQLADLDALCACHCTITAAPSRPIAARWSRTCASTARCTASSRSTPPGRARASPNSPVAHHPRRFGKSKYGLGRIARVHARPVDRLLHRPRLRPADPVFRQARLWLSQHSRRPSSPGRWSSNTARTSR